MNNIDRASEGLALIMRGCESTLWEELPDGSFAVHGSKRGSYKVTQRQVFEAQELIKTGIPPLRGVLNPTPLPRASTVARTIKKRPNLKPRGKARY